MNKHKALRIRKHMLIVRNILFLIIPLIILPFLLVEIDFIWTRISHYQDHFITKPDTKRNIDTDFDLAESGSYFKVNDKEYIIGRNRFQNIPEPPGYKDVSYVYNLSENTEIISTDVTKLNETKYPTGILYYSINDKNIVQITQVDLNTEDAILHEVDLKNFEDNIEETSIMQTPRGQFAEIDPFIPILIKNSEETRKFISIEIGKDGEINIFENEFNYLFKETRGDIERDAMLSALNISHTLKRGDEYTFFSKNEFGELLYLNKYGKVRVLPSQWIYSDKNTEVIFGYESVTDNLTLLSVFETRISEGRFGGNTHLFADYEVFTFEDEEIWFTNKMDISSLGSNKEYNPNDLLHYPSFFCEGRCVVYIINHTENGELMSDIFNKRSINNDKYCCDLFITYDQTSEEFLWKYDKFNRSIFSFKRLISHKDSLFIEEIVTAELDSDNVSPPVYMLFKLF